MERKTIGAVAVLLAALLINGCATSDGPKIGVQLPDKYNTPDGMVLAPDGSIYVNIPNFNDDSYPAKILKISSKDEISEVATLPIHPETGKASQVASDTRDYEQGRGSGDRRTGDRLHSIQRRFLSR
ncbi:MAG: hypothetical protein ACYSWQ_30035 [Planctomycetota bacterium]|jgi:major membrane immunogen (membrane-anchored lipoprotein)